MKTLGIVLVALGILFFVYRGYTYVTREKVIDIGPLEVTTEKKKTVWFPPLLAAVCLGAGVVILVMGAKQKA